MKNKLFILMFFIFLFLNLNIFCDPDIFESTVIGKWKYDIEAILNSEAGQLELQQNPNAREDLEQLFSPVTLEFTLTEMITFAEYENEPYIYAQEYRIISIDGNEIVIEGMEQGIPNGVKLTLTVLDENHIKIKQEDIIGEFYLVRIEQ